MFAAVFALLVGAGPAGARGAANTFTVTGFSDGTGSCSAVDSNGSSMCPTLRAAVDQAGTQTNSPTIQLSAGTYQLTGQLELKASMSLTGTGPGESGGTTIQQTDGQSRVLQVDATSTSKLSGLEITGGHLLAGSGAGADGGGILALAKLTLENVRVTGNLAHGGAGVSLGQNGGSARGGGIAFPSGPAGSSIADSTIDDNQAQGGPGGAYPNGQAGNGGYGFGGGVMVGGSGPLAISNSMISGNTAAGASRGFTQTGTPGFPGNGEGGGVFANSGINIFGSTLSANTADGPGFGTGGGLYDLEAVATVVNSTVSGNAASSTGGSGNGGGIAADGSQAGLQLAGDTIAANSASTDAGDLEAYLGNPPSHYVFTVADTVIAQGSAPTGSRCDLHRSTNPPTSESYNLEDDGMDSCAFTAANHDLVGANPELQGALTSNGGPTQTLAPAPGSPVLGAGGSCLDPTSSPANQLLSTDQRGDPRPSPCDIGAFQSQHPKSVTAPAVSGRAARGQTLICSQGAWAGDGSLTFAFAWLRNGSPIPGTSTNTYVIGAADAGQALACRVTATYYGSVAAASPFVIVPSYPVITLLKLSVSPNGVMASLGCRGADGERCTGSLQLTLSETLRGRKVVGVAKAELRTLTAARHAYTLLARHTTTIRLGLSAAVSKLLARFRKLPLKLTVSQTTAVGTATVSSWSLKIRAPKRRRGGRR